jgi:hypothetical protein
MAKIEDTPTDDLSTFLAATFDPIPGANDLTAGVKVTHMNQYARLARFLSAAEAFANVATQLSEDLEQLYADYQEECDGPLKGAFSQVLRDIAHEYGFSSKDFLIVNTQIAHNDFAAIVTRKELFRDNFTRPHGEFTHAVQWLVMAKAFDFDVGELYKNSVRYRSNKNFDASGEQKEIYMWNFLVDCFEGNGEDYENNITCNTFRCPQYTTKNLKNLTSTSWLGEFIYNRSRKFNTSHYRSMMVVTMGKEYLKQRKVDGVPVYQVVKASQGGSAQILRKVVVERKALPEKQQKKG